jgi:hypothetical protein
MSDLKRIVACWIGIENTGQTPAGSRADESFASQRLEKAFF